MSSGNKLSWSSKNRPCKNYARDLAIDSKHLSDYTGCAAVFLPGTPCKDIKLALEKRSISKFTKLIIIEQNKRRLRTIRENINKLVFRKKPIFYCGSLETINNAKWNNFLQDKNIYYAYFDICGEFTLSIAKWISSLRKEYFKDDCKIVFTFHNYRRSKDLYNKIKQKYLIDKNWPVKWIKRDEKNNGIIELKQEEINPKISEQLPVLLSFLNFCTTHLCLDIEKIIAYKDSAWMFSIHCKINCY